MDFTQLDLILQHVSSCYKVDEQEVLDKWMEKREVQDPEGWRLLEGIPCIAGGLTVLLRTLEGRGGTIPWKTLPQVLAHRGCILENYPEDILMPSERCPTVVRSKGIHDLTTLEHFKLADALKNNVLTIKSIPTDARKSLAKFCAPVIIGEAPTANSPHTHGRRVFANGQIDRHGLTHLGNTSASSSNATSPKPRRLRVFVELPPVPPTWKLKAAQQCPPIGPSCPTRQRPPIGPSRSQLIPHIAVMSAAKDKEQEVDELVSSQPAVVNCEPLEPLFHLHQSNMTYRSLRFILVSLMKATLKSSELKARTVRRDQWAAQ
ncbi:hypothetical protein BDR03DRAFT_977582 [Suillus americanus]|nr:hypothetical protein BDR03DRAFT_977582 [Suillus americanus]